MTRTSLRGSRAWRARECRLPGIHAHRFHVATAKAEEKSLAKIKMSARTRRPGRWARRGDRMAILWLASDEASFITGPRSWSTGAVS